MPSDCEARAYILAIGMEKCTSQFFLLRNIFHQLTLTFGFTYPQLPEASLMCPRPMFRLGKISDVQNSEPCFQIEGIPLRALTKDCSRSNKSN